MGTTVYQKSNRIGIFTIFSRLLGLLRDMTIAAVFGATSGADAFWAAFQVHHVGRKLFSEGAISAGFISTFTHIRSQEGEEKMMSMMGAVLQWTFFLSVGLIVIGMLTASWWVPVLVPGFVRDPELLTLTIRLSRWLLPYLGVVAFLGVSMAILHVYGFVSPSAMARLLF